MDWYLQHLLVVLINASPWIIGGGIGLAALGFSPFGRSLTRGAAGSGKNSDTSMIG